VIGDTAENGKGHRTGLEKERKGNEEIESDRKEENDSDRKGEIDVLEFYLAGAIVTMARVTWRKREDHSICVSLRL